MSGFLIASEVQIEPDSDQDEEYEETKQGQMTEKEAIPECQVITKDKYNIEYKSQIQTRNETWIFRCRLDIANQKFVVCNNQIKKESILLLNS